MQVNDSRLRVVFSLVEDPSNWKLEIDSVIPAGLATAEEVREAVIYFTGSVPTVQPTEMLCRMHPEALVMITVPALHVRAIGYYAAVGA